MCYLLHEVAITLSRNSCQLQLIMRHALNTGLQFYLHALHDCHLLISHSDDGLLISFLCIFLWTHCVSRLSVLSLDSFFFRWLGFFSILDFIFLQRKGMNSYSTLQKVFLSQPVPSMAASSEIFSNFVIWFPTTFQHGIVYF